MADKQTVLVEAISTGVHNKLTPELQALATNIAKISVTQNATLARLEVLETALNTGAPTAKRAVRTGGTAGAGTAAAKKSSSTKSGSKKPAGSDPSKVTNALLYFRYAMANDLCGFRELYATEENIDSIRHDESFIKKEKEKEKDESGYYSSVGHALWRITLTDEQKAEIRTQFGLWKEDAAREGAEPQLEEEEEEAAE
jgi:hypothetical protein